MAESSAGRPVWVKVRVSDCPREAAIDILRRLAGDDQSCYQVTGARDGWYRVGFRGPAAGFSDELKKYVSARGAASSAGQSAPIRVTAVHDARNGPQPPDPGPRYYLVPLDPDAVATGLRMIRAASERMGFACELKLRDWPDGTVLVLVSGPEAVSLFEEYLVRWLGSDNVPEFTRVPPRLNDIDPQERPAAPSETDDDSSTGRATGKLSLPPSVRRLAGRAQVVRSRFTGGKGRGA